MVVEHTSRRSWRWRSWGWWYGISTRYGVGLSLLDSAHTSRYSHSPLSSWTYSQHSSRIEDHIPLIVISVGAQLRSINNRDVKLPSMTWRWRKTWQWCINLIWWRTWQWDRFVRRYLEGRCWRSRCWRRLYQQKPHHHPPSPMYNWGDAGGG